jgi:patatin-related protein
MKSNDRVLSTGVDGSQKNSSHECPPLEKETRFAVVMYGGVSLAIYIYGVTKELYSMVRATARKINNENSYLLDVNELSETEKIYRRLGEDLQTRFVIDILSGTSAGGINAIYLAKALSNAQSIDGLKGIWLDQGDIARLINDKKSEVEGLGVKNQPTSLLNSQRMYFHLLKALHEMDANLQIPVANGLSPFVNELDLYITATDIRGLTVDLPVANARVHESRFRNVFRFHYSTQEAAGRETESETDAEKVYSNDFVKDNNPFLAFAARCTSSFPFAFEPMQLEDIKSVLQTETFEEYKYKPEIWSAFYKEYEKAGDDFSARSFGDGGYLDNKPFSYATEALLRRRADQPVDRKLIYIDPSPEHPQNVKAGEKPDAFQNVLAALLSIPRYEPIREDLERVIERNQLIHRVNNFIDQINPVLTDKRNVRKWQKNAKAWVEKYFDKELLDWFGISYATYHQLRVASVLEEWGSAILRAFSWSETGMPAENLNALLEGWRDDRYTTDPQLRKTHMSENDILFRLDTSWRMRRLLFLQNVINKLLKAVHSSSRNEAPEERKKILADAGQILKTSGIKLEISKLDGDKIRKELTEIKKEINDAYGYLRARGRKLRSQSLIEKPQSDRQIQAYVNKLSELKKYLEEPAGSAPGRTRLDELAGELQSTSPDKSKLKEVFNKIEKLSCVLSDHLPNTERKGYICQSLLLVSGKVKSALGSKPARKGERDARTLLQKCLSYYYESFEYYDMLIFPIYYGTGVEESDEVEIIRVSPEDATNLFDEKNKKKLAGTTLANFGAFFVREWRENDMMWGRLDGAECLVRALKREGQDRAELIEEIHRVILKDELTPLDEVRIYRAKNEAEKAGAEKALMAKYKSGFGLKDGESKMLLNVVERLSSPEKITENFRHGYSIETDFPPRDTLLAGSRAMRVFGNLLNGLSSNHKVFSTPAKWITSAGGILAGILSVTLPNSLGNFLVAGYWVWLLYVFEILLGGAGWLFGSADLKQIGIVSFALTFLSHLLLTVINRWLDRRIQLRFIRILASILVVALIAGLLFLVYFGLLGLGVLQIPDGLLGEWFGRLVRDCPKTLSTDAMLFCRPTK